MSDEQYLNDLSLNSLRLRIINMKNFLDKLLNFDVSLDTEKVLSDMKDLYEYGRKCYGNIVKEEYTVEEHEVILRTLSELKICAYFINAYKEIISNNEDITTLSEEYFSELNHDNKCSIIFSLVSFLTVTENLISSIIEAREEDESQILGDIFS